MKYRVELTPRVSQDIRQIRSWYRERSSSEEVGNKRADGLFERLEQLESNPEQFPLARESPLFSDDVHEVYYGSGRRKTHRILFRVLGDNVLEVMAIRHFAQQDVAPDDL